jgi:glycosyltransferase involved in cell wall biosynthesis
MNGSPLFSIILPTYGRPQFLRDALASVLAQTLQNFECIVVDDGSPTPVDPDSDDRIQLIRRLGKGGAAAARNSGLEVARGKYVVFLDDDDLYKPDRLRMALRGLATAPLAVCWRSRLDGRSETLDWNDYLTGDVHDRILERPVPHLGQLAIERRLAPRFDERFEASEDVEWWLRASAVGDIVTVPEVGYMIRYHSLERLTRRTSERLTARLLLIASYPSYFGRNRRAAAYQWTRVGGLATAIGDVELARRAFRRALSLRPRPRQAAHLARSYARRMT